MATKIVTKNSSTAGAAPTATDLVQGELAVNVADGRLYTEDNAAAIVELGVNPATEITANAGIAFPDSQKATFGAGDDLQIFHDGSNSYIQDQGLSGTGNLILAGADVEIATFGGNKYFLGSSNVARLYHTNNEKLATTATGIDVTGTASATSVTSTQHLTAGSAYSLLFGDGGERISGNNSSSLLNFFTGATERMRIDSTGKVGIGTSSPTQKLHVDAGEVLVKSAYNANGTTNSKIYFATRLTGNWRNTYIGNTGDALTLATGGTGTTHTNATERMRIDAAGNVGINNSSPLFPLCISRSSNPNRNGMEFAIGAADTSGNTIQNFNRATGAYTGLNIGASVLTFGVGTSATERMRIDSNGKLLVGKTASGFVNSNNWAVEGASVVQGHVSSLGSGSTYTYFVHGTSLIGSITQNGTTGILYNTSSDQRLKENIADADDAGSKVDAIQVRQYDWKADGSHQDYGMIAQELLEVAPEAVSGDADSEEMMGVDYSKLVPMLIKEIQSLRNRVAQLETGE